MQISPASKECDPLRDFILGSASRRDSTFSLVSPPLTFRRTRNIFLPFQFLLHHHHCLSLSLSLCFSLCDRNGRILIEVGRESFLLTSLSTKSPREKVPFSPPPSRTGRRREGEQFPFCLPSPTCVSLPDQTFGKVFLQHCF